MLNSAINTQQEVIWTLICSVRITEFHSYSKTLVSQLKKQNLTFLKSHGSVILVPGLEPGSLQLPFPTPLHELGSVAETDVQDPPVMASFLQALR